MRVCNRKWIEVERANGQAGDAGPPLIDDASMDADVRHRFRQVTETYAARPHLSTADTRGNTCICPGRSEPNGTVRGGVSRLEQASSHSSINRRLHAIPACPGYLDDSLAGMRRRDLLIEQIGISMSHAVLEVRPLIR